MTKFDFFYFFLTPVLIWRPATIDSGTAGELFFNILFGIWCRGMFPLLARRLLLLTWIVKDRSLGNCWWDASERNKVNFKSISFPKQCCLCLQEYKTELNLLTVCNTAVSDWLHLRWTWRNRLLDYSLCNLKKNLPLFDFQRRLL